MNVAEPINMNATQEQKPRGHRLWMVALIGILAVIGIAYVQFQPELEGNFKNLLTTCWLRVVANQTCGGWEIRGH